MNGGEKINSFLDENTSSYSFENAARSLKHLKNNSLSQRNAYVRTVSVVCFNCYNEKLSSMARSLEVLLYTCLYGWMAYITERLVKLCKIYCFIWHRLTWRVCTDGRAGGRAGVRHVITKFSRMDSLLNFVTHGAPLRALRARERSATKKIQLKVVRHQHHLQNYLYYRKNNIIPKGLVSKCRPTIFTNNPHFHERWRKNQLISGRKYLNLLIRECRKIIKTLEEQFAITKERLRKNSQCCLF